MKLRTSTVAYTREVLLAMPSNQKDFKRFLNSYGKLIFLHLLKIHCFPNHPASNHWKAEVKNWIEILVQQRKALRIHVSTLDTDLLMRSKFDIFKEWNRIHSLGQPHYRQVDAKELVRSLSRVIEPILSLDRVTYSDLSSLFPA
jgi:hypothetical protein